MTPYPSRDVRPAPLFTLFWFIVINFYVAIPFQKCQTNSFVHIILVHCYQLLCRHTLPEMSDQFLCSHYFGSLLSTFMTPYPSRDVRPTPLFTLCWFIVINFYVAIPFQRCQTSFFVHIMLVHYYKLLWHHTLPEMSDQLLCSHYFGSLLSTFMSPYPSRNVRPAPLFTLFWFIIINFYVTIPFQKCWTRSVVCIVCLHWYELTSLPFQTEVSYQVLSVINWVHYYWLMSLPFQRCRTVLSVSVWLINHNPSGGVDCLVDLPFQRYRTLLAVSLWSINHCLSEVSDCLVCITLVD